MAPAEWARSTARPAADDGPPDVVHLDVTFPEDVEPVAGRQGGTDADSIIVVRLLPETAGDLYLLSLRGAFPPRALVATPAYEGSPHLSRDGRWLAYQSNASGMPEIYVRRYPQLDRAWQVSEGGGVQVRWGRSGNELFYRANQQMMAVAFDGTQGGTLRVVLNWTEELKRAIDREGGR